MFSLSTILAAAVLVQTTISAPLSIPLGSSGLSLTIDGQQASMNGEPVDLAPALAQMNAAKACNSPPQGKAGKAKGKGKGKGGKGQAAAGAAGNSSAAQGNANAQVIYMISNANGADNSVIALKVGADGQLSDGSVTPTGGKGMVGVDATGQPATPDGLFSQASVKAEGNMLVAVNPGSNTASLFNIDAQDPTKLTMVGQPVDTMGEFPVSATISTALNMACVANSGAKAGVACYQITAKGLVAQGGLRPFDINQTTPPAGPLNTVSQTFFNADSTALLTTVKGDPTKNNTGFLSSFPVAKGAVSMTGTQVSPKGTAVLFGSSTLPGTSDIFVTDASFGSATISNPTGADAAVSASTKIDGQDATCWAAVSPTTGTAFITDVGHNTLNEVDVKTGALVKAFNGTNGNLGMIDLAAKGNFVYALAPGNATAKVAPTVAVFDVSGGKGTFKEVQNFAIKGATDSVQGMTAF